MSKLVQMVLEIINLPGGTRIPFNNIKGRLTGLARLLGSAVGGGAENRTVERRVGVPSMRPALRVRTGNTVSLPLCKPDP